MEAPTNTGRSIFWVHPRMMDYRLPLFRQLADRHELHFHLTEESAHDGEFRTTIAVSKKVRMPALADVSNLWRGCRDSEVVISSFLWSGYSVLCLIFAKLQGRKVVIWEERSRDFTSFKHTVKRWLLRRLAPLVDAFFVMGRVHVDVLERIGVNRTEVFRTNEYPGVVYASVTPSDRQFPVEEGLPAVTFLGRLVEVKGIEYLLDAMADVPQATLLIAGDGPLRSSLNDRVAALGITNVEFLGEVNTWQDKAALLARSSVLVVPSITTADGQSEGGPLVVLEALSAGVPVVTSDSVGSSSEFVEAGVNGFVVPEKNAEALADKISHTLTNAESMAVGARESFAKIADHAGQAAVLEQAMDHASGAR